MKQLSLACLLFLFSPYCRIANALEIGDQAPGFNLNILEKINHKKLDLKIIRESTVVVLFFATIDLYSKSLLPEYKALYEKYKTNRKVQFLSIAADDRPKGLEKFIEAKQVKFPVLSVQQKSKLSFLRDFGVWQYPTILVILPDGTVVWKSFTAGALGKYIQDTLDGKITPEEVFNRKELFSTFQSETRDLEKIINPYGNNESRELSAEMKTRIKEQIDIEKHMVTLDQLIQIDPTNVSYYAQKAFLVQFRNGSSAKQKIEEILKTAAEAVKNTENFMEMYLLANLIMRHKSESKELKMSVEENAVRFLEMSGLMYAGLFEFMARAYEFNGNSKKAKQYRKLWEVYR